MVDVCTTCHCTVQVGFISGFKLECRKTTCKPCSPVRGFVRDPESLGTQKLGGPKHWDLTGSVNKGFAIF